MRRSHLINKQTKKKMEGKCHFCSCDDYSLLDVHRIVPGEVGGKYTDYNSIVLCSLCHRKVHSGVIKILGKYYSTAAKWVVHYMEDGQEKWL